jgi:uncharacterized membrane protein YkvA (DUF1232 family)
MATLARAAVAGVCVLALSWLALVLLARRLPPGVMKELAAFLPNCVRLIRTLRRDPAVPRRAKVVVAFAALWVLSPIDLIPEFLPVIGALDDVVVVAFALRYAARLVPRAVLLDAWDGDPRTIDRLLGSPRSPLDERQREDRTAAGLAQRVRGDGHGPAGVEPVGDDEDGTAISG